MRKNGSRLISVKQYRLTDLFLFVLILAVSELIGYFAAGMLPSEAYYTVSFSIPIILLVMMRWGWPSVLYSLLSGLIVCLMNVGKVSGHQWACYLIGNAFIALMLIPRYLIGSKAINSKWWAMALFAIGGWLCVYLGRSIVWAIGFAVSPVDGQTAASGFVTFAQSDLLSLAMGVVLMLVLRKLDGMTEDQNEFLRRLDTERKDKQKVDEFYDNGAELDEEALEILSKSDNDLY
ncbi:MAG: hypothetical protein ACI4MQ_03500 [Candidatus Coproplasma sp.]